MFYPLLPCAVANTLVPADLLSRGVTVKIMNWIAGLGFAAASTVALAGSAVKPVVDFTVEEQTSIPGGVVPELASANANSLFYPYETAAGTAISDSLPVKLCASSTAGHDKDGIPTTGYPQTVHFSASAGNLPGVTVPGDVTFGADGCQTVYINIDTGALLANSYMGNINISLANSQDASVTTSVNTTVNLGKPNEVHIHVKATAPTVSISCFTTDSDFNFLVDCAGNAVTSGYGGVFSIVTNKKNVEVATNPGQFYYNLLYTNSSGHDQTVAVTFLRNGVNPNGAQAIHAMLFPTFPLFSSTNFDLVNNDIPSGADDKLEGITVPAGWTLWTDYHVEWTGVGSPAPSGIGASCPSANQTFGVTGTVTADGTVVGSCGAGAVGYKK